MNDEISVKFDTSYSYIEEAVEFDEELLKDTCYDPNTPEFNLETKRSYLTHYRCISDDCGKIFPNKGNLKRYKCNIINCADRFSSRITIIKHVGSHPSLMGFGCPFCDFIGYEIEDMKEHLVNHPEKSITFLGPCKSKDI
ncbi:Zinc finger and BTB domain-containing protein 17 [Thelohanellus kitauei]|uniref:Zinc finger and BTB domain-containing protein 17 n=1 Tax=Thelohanellus kitauei TaxID=669202 RepID=A0A0C2N567_THEKT|nr:Zinc finger and BTB domain-containing protein 17 [Thelohanellus kitauei]